jgi:hypothetical protein
MRASSFIAALHFFAIEMSWVRVKDPMNPSSSFADIFGLKSEFGGNRQHYLGSCSWITEEIQLGANSFSPFPHSPQAPASRFSRMQHLSVDAATVVLNQHTEPICGVFHLDFGVGCSRVLKRIHDCFASDSMDIVQENRPQRSRAPHAQAAFKRTFVIGRTCHYKSSRCGDQPLQTIPEARGHSIVLPLLTAGRPY